MADAPEQQEPEQQDVGGALIPVGERGIVPASVKDLWRFSQYAHASGLAPKGLETPAKIFIATQYGMELGFSPMQALSHVAVIHGRPSLWGDALMALILSHPAYEYHREGHEGKEGADDYMAWFEIKRKKNPEAVRKTYSVAQAKRAGLWGKPGSWQTDPDQMLMWRARGRGIRSLFADALKGIILAEEAMDYPNRGAGASTVEVVNSAVTPPSSAAEKLVGELRESPQVAPEPEVSIPPATESKPPARRAAKPKKKAEPSEGQDESSADPLAGLQAADCVNGENLYFCPHGGVCQGLGLMNRQGLIVHLDKMHKGKLS